MSLCPYCHSQDKNFFASKCHNCNTEVSFGEQVAGSTVWVGVQVIVVLLLLLLIFG